MTEPEHGITPDMVVAASGGQLDDTVPGIAQAIDGTVESFRRWCGWHVWPTWTHTEVLDGPGTRVVQLPTLHMTRVSKVSEDGESLDTDTDLTWSQRGWLTRLGARHWTDADRGIEVEYTDGYDQPADLVRLVCQAVLRDVGNPYSRSRIQVGQRSESFDAAAISGVGLLFGTELATLAEYRIPR